MNKMSPEILLAEIDDIIRVMPPTPELRAVTPENMSWIARASAAMVLWSPFDGSRFEAEIREMIESSDGTRIMHALRRALTRLRQASHQLRMQTTGPLSIAVVKKRPFEYFNEVRTIIEGAKVDLFFVDPYLDAEFADRYLPQVS